MGTRTHKNGGGRRVGARRVGPKFRAFFSFSQPHFYSFFLSLGMFFVSFCLSPGVFSSLFSSLCGCSRGIWVVFQSGPQMCLFSPGLSCGSPRRPAEGGPAEGGPAEGGPPEGGPNRGVGPLAQIGLATKKRPSHFLDRPSQGGCHQNQQGHGLNWPRQRGWPKLAQIGSA